MKAQEAQVGRGCRPATRPRDALAILHGIPIFGTLNIVLSVLTVLRPVPPGTSIRPMGVALRVMLVAAVTAAFGFAPGRIALACRWRRPGIAPTAAPCLLPTFTPWCSGGWTWKWVVERHGLVRSK
jgi:hypothetical protein